MPELRCPECGNELLPPRPDAADEPCVCYKCGRNVYVRTKTKVETKCSKCGRVNVTTIAR